MKAKSFKTETLYVDADGTYFFSPDGRGRIFYDTLEELREDTGLPGRLVRHPYSSHSNAELDAGYGW